MAQVRLSFQNTNGAKMVCTRSLQLTVKKTTRAQKTLDGQLLIWKDNQRSTVSSKCVELDQMLPDFLGVSRSILDNVIFCHQEESMWPLSEPSVLKKKFDEIFEAQKYTKAIDNIKALRKKQVEEIKRLKLMQDRFKVDKERCERAEKKTENLSAQIEELRNKREELSREISKIRDEINSHWQTAASFEKDIALLNTKRLNAQKTRELVEDLEQDIDLKPDSDEELQHRLENFQNEMEQLDKKIANKESQKKKLKDDQTQFRARLARKADQKGNLQARKEQYERQLVSRQEMINEASSIHQIRGFGAGELDDRQVADFMSKIERLNREQLGNLERAKKEGREEHAQAVKALNDLENQRSSLEQAKRYANNEISRLNGDIKSIQYDMNRLQVDEGKIARLEHKFATENEQVEQLKAQDDQEQWDERLRAKANELRDVEDRVTIETKELTKGTAEAETKARLSYYTKELEGKKNAQQSLILANSDKFDRIFSNWTVKTIEDDFHNALEQQDDDVSKASKLLDGSNTELSQVESQLKIQKDLLRKKTKELERSSQLVIQAMEVSNFDECADYQNVVEEKEKGLITARDDLAAEAYAISNYEKAIKIARNKKCCRMCRREYVHDQDLADFIDFLQSEVDKISTGEVEKEAAQHEEELKGLKEVSLDFEIATRLKDQEIPQINQEISKLQKKQETLVVAYESRKKSLDEKNASKRAVEALRRPVSEIQKYDTESADLEKQIAILSRQLEESGSSRSVEDIQRALQSLNEKGAQLKLERDALQTDKDNSRQKISSKQKQLQETNMQLAEARHQFREKETQAKRLADCNELIQQKVREISDAESQAEPLKREIVKAKGREDDVKQKWEEQEQTLQKIAHGLSDTLRGLKTIERDIRNYIESDAEADLVNVVNEATDLQNKIDGIEGELQAVEAELVQTRAEKGKEDNLRRSIADNIRLRRNKKELQVLIDEIKELESKNAEADRDRFSRKAETLQHGHDALVQERTGAAATIKQLDTQLADILQEYEVDFRDAKKNFHEGQIRLQTTEVANDDLQKYQTALDQAVMKYHSLKMEEVNRIIDDLWKKTYKGTDVDTILIRSEQENAKGNRLYNYRVCMVKQDAELDMRGRCSAGQKVLASIIIRLALAECFGTNCGLIALDEPTTNLDRDNSRALAQALHDIISYRSAQKNFQLIVITHDEDFLRDMKCSQFTEYYYRVSRDQRQKSIIERQSIAEVDK